MSGVGSWPSASGWDASCRPSWTGMTGPLVSSTASAPQSWTRSAVVRDVPPACSPCCSACHHQHSDPGSGPQRTNGGHCHVMSVCAPCHERPAVLVPEPASKPANRRAPHARAALASARLQREKNCHGRQACAQVVSTCNLQAYNAILDGIVQKSGTSFGKAALCGELGPWVALRRPSRTDNPGVLWVTWHAEGCGAG